MNEKELKLYLNEQIYNELVEHGYIVLTNNHCSIIHKEDKDAFFKRTNYPYVVSEKFPKVFVEESYSYFIDHDYYYDNKYLNSDKHKQFILKIQVKHIELFLKNNPESYDLILSALSKMRNVYFKDIYQEYFRAVGSTKKAFISHFHKISLSNLSVNILSTKELISLAKEHQLDEKETQNFFFKFYKKRSNQVKNPNTGLALRDDVLSYFDYNEEKLTPYFPVFPMLEQYFKNSGLNTSVNIFEQEYKYCAYAQINYSTMFKEYLIKKWSKYDYKQNIAPVIAGISLYYKLDLRYVFSEDGKNSLINIILLYNNADFNQDLLKHDFVHFFKYLYTDPAFVVDELSVYTWLTQFYLSKTLNEKDATTIKKNKL